MFNLKNLSVSIKYSLVVSGAVLLALATLTAFYAHSLKTEAENSIELNIRNLAKIKAYEVETMLGTPTGKIKYMANYFSQYNELPEESRRETYKMIINNNIKNEDQYLSLWTIWEHFSIDSFDSLYKHNQGLSSGRFFVKFNRNRDEIIETVPIKSQENEIISSTLYSNPKNIKLEYISEPTLKSYTDGDYDDLLEVSITAPILNNDRFEGVVGVSISIANVKNKLLENKTEDVNINLISYSGRIVVHQNNSYSTKDFSTVYSELNASNKIIKQTQQGREFFISEEINKAKHFIAFHPVYIGQSLTPWSVMVFISHKSVYQKSNLYILISIFFAAIALIFIGIITKVYLNQLINPIKILVDSLGNLAAGEIPKITRLSVQNNDELSKLINKTNQLIDTYIQHTYFANKLSEGNLESNYKAIGDNDKLGHSLLSMQKSLLHAQESEKQRKEQDVINNWKSKGLTDFATLLQQNYSNLNELAYRIINKLVEYLNASQAGLFIYNDDDNNNLHLELLSAYAYDRKKALKMKVDINDGLLGTSIKERKTIFLTELPKGYIELTSGLGKTIPTCLLIVPLISEGEILGVIELTSLNKFKEYELEFVTRIAESVATTLASAKMHAKTAFLLATTRLHSEEISQREELMRQNLEELKATQEESLNREVEMSGVLSAINAASLVAEIDLSGDFISLNEKFLQILGITNEQIYRKKHKDLLADISKPIDYYNSFWNDLRSGKTRTDVIQIVNSTGYHWISQLYTPIFDNNGKPYKVLNIAVDISETKKQEQELIQQSEEIALKEAELRSIFNAIDTATYTAEFALDGEILNISQNYAKILGKSRQKLIGDYHRKITGIPQEEYDTIWSNILAGNTEKREQEIRLLGQSVWLAEIFAPILDNKGKPKRIINIAFDITESKLQQFELKNYSQEIQLQKEKLNEKIKELENVQNDIIKKEQVLRNIFTAIDFSVGSFEMDLDGNILRVNEKFSKLINIAEYNLIDANHEDLYEYVNIEKEKYQQMWSKFGAGQSAEAVFMFNTTKGELWLHESFTPLIGNSGKYEKILVFVIDISQSKNLERELRYKTDDLMSREQILTQKMIDLAMAQEEMLKEQERLEIQSRKMKDNERQLQEAIEIASRQEIEIKTKNNVLMLREKELEESIKKTNAIKNTLEQTNLQIELTNKMLLENEEKLKASLQRAVEQENIINEKNSVLVASEEELRQNLEEMQTIQDELLRKEEELRGMLTAIDNTVGSIEMDMSGKILRVNDAYAKMHKIKPHQLIGKHHSLLIDSDYLDKEKYQKMWMQFEEGIISEKEVCYNTPIGHLWLHETYTPLVDHHGQYAKVLTLAINISSSKALQFELQEAAKELTVREEELREHLEMIQITREELEKKEAELRSIVDAIGFSTFLAEYDLNGYLININDAYLKLFNIQKRQMIGKHYSEIVNINREDADTFFHEIMNGAIQRKVFENESNNIKNWISETYAPILDSKGQPNRILVIGVDITKSKQQQQQLEHQAVALELSNKELEKLSIVASETDNAVIITDAVGNLEWVNDGFTRLTGFTLDDLLIYGKNLTDASSNKGLTQIIEKCKTTKSSAHYESFFIKKDNTKIWLHTTLTPIVDKKGRVSRLIAIDSDITKIKKAEEEILSQKSKLEEQNQEIRLQSEALELQKNKIIEQNRDIKASIRYAFTIQQAHLPIREKINKLFNNFIIYFPKDIVSGDFYWYSHIDKTMNNSESIVFAVVDCTGHGVPGAFMSVIGTRLLNEIVNQKQIYATNQILELLNEGIKKALKQEETHNNDGMDVCLCHIIKESEQRIVVNYSGANRPLFYYRKTVGEIEIIKGDRKSIGGARGILQEEDFSVKQIILQPQDTIYLTSDGLIDQNNPTGKRFGTKKFITLLDSIATLPMPEQGTLIELALDRHQLDTEQRDDVTVIGIQM